MSRNYFAALILLPLIMTGAAQAQDLKPDRPLEIESSMCGPVLRQNGVALSSASAIEEFQKSPATEGAAQVANIFWYAVIPTAFASGCFLTAAFINREGSARNFAWAGGLFGTAVMFELLKRQSLRTAAEIHNRNLPAPRGSDGRSAGSSSPVIALVPGGAVGGFTIQF